MADKDKPDKLKVTEHPDGSYVFELRDDVFAAVAFASEKKLRFQMWQGTVMLPSDEGNIFTTSFRDRLAKQARDGFGKDKVPNIVEDIGRLAQALGSREGDGKSLSEKISEKESLSIVQKLIGVAEELAGLFHTPDGEPMAACQRGGHTEVHELDSKEFKMWLRSEFRRTECERLEKIAQAERDRHAEVYGAISEDLGEIKVPRAPAVPELAIKAAIDELRVTAVLNGPEEEVHLRVAGHEGRIYIDLGDESWQAVEVDGKGWRIVNEVPVRFVRSNVMLPLPRPAEKGGSVEPLRQLLTLRGEQHDGDWSLILAWLVQALRPHGEQYPVLILLGGHGTGKSTALELLRELVDPAVVAHSHSYREVRDLYIDGVASWVIALDNISSLPDWLSDTVCRLATGGGFKTRTLFTDREQQVFKAQRPVILNGISDVATKPDLLSRALLVNLPVIPESDRRYLADIRAEFEKEKPVILAGLLDAISRGLMVVEDVDLDGHKTRMPDFDRWAVATEAALGLERGTFIKARESSSENATKTALEAEPIWRGLLGLAEEHGEDEPWVGIMKDLLAQLNEREKDEPLKRSKDWPKTERKLSSVVSRLAPALLELGIHIEEMKGSRKHGRRYKMFHRDADSDVE